MPAHVPTSSLYDARDGLSRLLGDLEHRSGKVRYQAALALGNSQQQEARKPLEACLEDKDAQVRLAATVSLIRLGDKGLYEQILAALQSAETDVAVGAALILAKLKEPASFWHLIQAFQTNNGLIGSAAAYALGELGNSQALPWLMSAIEHGFVVPNACEALGKIGDLKGLPVLLSLLSHPATNIRALSAKALSSIYYAENIDIKYSVLQQLEPLLQDPMRKVRLCAAFSFQQLKR